MALNLYGTVAKNITAPFVFDKIYTSRVEMDAACSSDGVYNGRYVLVSYGDERYGEPTETEINNSNITVSYNGTWAENYALDMNQYHNNEYDLTVWQKIFTNDSASYGLVARLRTTPPALSIDNSIPTLTMKSDDTSTASYWIKSSDDTDPQPLTGHTLHYTTPEWRITSDINYTLNVAKPLELSLPAITYNRAGFNPRQHTEIANTATEIENQQIRWVYNVDTSDEEAEKHSSSAYLDIQLPALGKLVSDLYDVLYGKPASGNGARPSYNGDMASLADIGIAGVLKNLSKGETQSEDDSTTIYYKLICDWAADDNQAGRIENKPATIARISFNDRNNTITFQDSTNQALFSIDLESLDNDEQQINNTEYIMTQTSFRDLFSVISKSRWDEFGDASPEPSESGDNSGSSEPTEE